MARIVQFPVKSPVKLGPKKARRKRKSLEDHGQLNLFDQGSDNTPIRSLNAGNALFERALELDEAGDAQAEKYYLLAAEKKENIADAYCNLGILKSSQGNFPKALDYLTQCLQHNPRHFEAHYNCGNVYSEIGNLKLAKIHYEVAIEIEPHFPNSHYNLGLVLISLKSYTEAIASIHQYLSLSPENEHQTANELIKTLNTIAK